VRVRTVALLAIAACWTGAPPSQPVTKPVSTAPTATTAERRAILRIDAEPGGKRFQGVWLEFASGARWVIDYRPRLPWRGFEGREVLVTGRCYAPVGQAIGATHFRVETLRVADAARGAQPYVEVGPEQRRHGELVVVNAPAGSKLAGTASLMFRDSDGEMWPTLSDAQLQPGPAIVRARVLVADMAYVARSGSADLWIADLVADGDPDPDDRDTPIDCPTESPRR
jgi:hypothetical protein